MMAEQYRQPQHGKDESGRKPVLSVHGLTKRIKGKTIVQDMRFDVMPGEIFGFLGPNGAGKTTTIRMLVGLIKPSSGSVAIGGYDVQRQPEEALAQVGCIVENPEVYPYLTGRENLEQFARMQAGVDSGRIREVVETVGLSQRIDDKVKTYSLGMRQRLGIAQALLGKPRLLILDEPTNGLDPLGIKELRVFVRSLADQGMSLFISSHLLGEIQLMCDRVAIISSGRSIAVGSVDELVHQAGSYVAWQLDQPELGRRLLTALPHVTLLADGEHRIDETVLAAMPGAIVASMPEASIPDAVRLLVQEGVGVSAVQRIMPSLEQLFLGMTEGETIA
jgi:ABC-2 type transport system ATP-binding protein